MRLLDTTTLELKEFYDKNIPRYGILSHTWGDEEITIGEMKDGSAKSKGGYQKILLCCAQAVKDRLSWVWCDTCCIDKRSSAELSEAINSMFRWYKNAELCYAYLADVPAGEDVTKEDSAFSRSKWHGRGWTLQELLAPEDVIFYSVDWQQLGAKDDLANTLSKVTGISLAVLTHKKPFQECSIAQRMSWASRRETTRIEDTAYCLMGLFDIHMPLLYGEGEKAFIRLQEEIMKNSEDQSLFAWRMLDASESCRGLLATSPVEFRDSSEISTVNLLSRWRYRTEIVHQSINRGILAGFQSQENSAGNLCVAILACEELNIVTGEKGGVAILFYLTDRKYSRAYAHCILSLTPTTFYYRSSISIDHGKSIELKQLCVRKSGWTYEPQPFNNPFIFLLDTNYGFIYHADLRYSLEETFPTLHTQSVMFVGSHAQTAGAILLQRVSKDMSTKLSDFGSCKYVHLFVGIGLGLDRSSAGASHDTPWCHFRGYRRRKDLTKSFAKIDSSLQLDSGWQPVRELELKSGVKMVADIVEAPRGIIGFVPNKEPSLRSEECGITSKTPRIYNIIVRMKCTT